MKVLIVCLIALCGSYAESVAVHCEFIVGYYGYKCEAKSLRITSKDDRTINEVTGEHLSGKNDSDVKWFESINHKVQFFPLELATFFKNLETVSIYDATLSEIHSSDLKQFGGYLRQLWLGRNVVEVLDADLFQFNPNVDYVSFRANKLRHIDDGTFRDLKKLKKLYLQGNPCIDEHTRSKNKVVALITEAELKCKA